MPTRPVSSDTTPIDFVNPLQGTDSKPQFSTGNTLPLIALPHGMTHWSPQTSGGSGGWFFHPHDRVLEGIRATHQPSPWMGDYSCFTLMPQTGARMPEPGRRLSALHTTETVYRPDRFQAYLLRYECGLMFAPTERCSILEVTLQSPDAETATRRLLLDLFPGAYEVRQEQNRIVGYTRYNRGGVTENFAFYFVIELDTPIQSLSVSEYHGGHHVAAIELTPGKAGFTARIGTSFISIEQAALNLAQEIGDRTVEQIAEIAADRWNRLLGRIEIPGATETQKRTFYSCLYRALLFPRHLQERDAGGDWHHFSPYDGRVHPGVLVTDNGFWDTFRTVYPLLALAYPDLLGAIIDGWLNAYQESGWLPEWASPGHRSCMIGTHSHAVLADAVAKGISGFDYETALEAVVKAADEPVSDDAGYGRHALNEYNRLGYVPCDRIDKATSRTMDYAYDDYCIAQIARVVGRDDLYERFMRQSNRWKNVFDPVTKFFRGRLASGEWQTPFDPYEWGGAFVEGSAYQFRFSVPHDPKGLAESMGGAEALASLVRQMAQEPPRYRVGSYGQEIHEMTEMALADFGQYAQSNQPVHNALFMAAAVGHPQITNSLVRRVLDELYTPDLFPGDEDNGEMAAWYVLCAIGLGPLCPGSPNYILIAPLFPEAAILLPTGATLRITSDSIESDTPVVAWNGATVSGPEIGYDDLIQGGELRFTADPEKTRS